jgi:cysteinyl-tRNA synthetase
LEREPKQVEVPEAVKKLVGMRNVARSEKDFAKSDQLRDDIAKYGFAVKDTTAGTEVEPIL